MPPQPPDETWIRSVLARYEGPLVRYAYSITGDLETARDAAQEAFIRLLDHPEVHDEPHAGRWLFTVCRNRCRDIMRRSRRTEALSGDALDGEASPADALQAKEGHAQLAAAVAGLPDSQREVVRLRFDGGLSYRDISEATGHTVSNVGFLLHSALKNLRAAWPDQS